jgi:proteasome accessory factor A
MVSGVQTGTVVDDTLMGIETEYALGGGQREEVIKKLVGLLDEGIPFLPGGGLYDRYLANGARFYMDSGWHPEWSTPECGNPTDTLRYALAGDKILSDALNRVQGTVSMGPGGGLFKCNVDYSGAKTTWGSHESYLHRSQPPVFPDQILPHLVSRVIYTGAGGFNPLSAGIDFTLSPRAWHLQHDVSESSTGGRGVFHTKNESLAKRGYRRLHLLCGESLCSHIASWLRIGTTALVVRLIDAGIRPGATMRLASPLDALKTFVDDPTCRATAECVDGPRVRAVDIQRHYLHIAEDNLANKRMPSWAEDVCIAWRNMLDGIENRPETLSVSLEWAIKLAIYTDRTERAGIPWTDLPAWGFVLDKIRDGLRDSSYEGKATVELVLGRLEQPNPIPEVMKYLKLYANERSLDWDMMRPVVDLRKELFELDFRFGQVGGDGLFDKLDRAGAIDHRVPGVENIEAAVSRPPAGGRARLRGARIEKFAGRPDFISSWTGIYDMAGRRKLDMSDPFATRARWRKMPRPAREEREQLRRLLVRGGGDAI